MFFFRVNVSWSCFTQEQFQFLCVCDFSSFGLHRFILSTSTMARQEASVFEAIKYLGVAGRSLSEQEHRDAARLCEVGKAALLEFSYDLVKSSHGRPLLYSYQGDGTPLKLRYKFQSRLTPHSVVHRSGCSGTEMYCQAAFLRTLDELGAPVLGSGNKYQVAEG